jgi:ATP adenylyltransferase
MDILWSPWRLNYILSAKTPGCVLCEKIHEDTAKDSENLLLWRGEHCFVILNLYPYATAHLMVVPYAHISDLTLLPSEVINELGQLTQGSIALLREVYHCEGFNLGMNLGKVAGAGIDDHLHLHIVPRWSGDINFMPLLAQTRTLPELLPDTFFKLQARVAQFLGNKA